MADRDGLRPSYLEAGQWVLGKSILNESNAQAICCNTFTTDVGGGSTLTGTALFVHNVGAAGSGGGPTTVTVGAGTVLANQGSSGAEAWPVQFLAAQPVNAIQSGAWNVSAVQSGAWSVAANITAGNVGVSSIPAISIAAGQSISAAITGTQNASIVNANPLAVQPRVTGNPSTVTFSLTQSSTAVVTLVGSTAGSRIVIKAYGVFNGDTVTHGFQVLASNTVVIPAFLAPNAGGHNIAYADPYPLVSNAGLNISLVGAVGANAVVGYFEVAMVPN